jgi:hypothetical protein
MAHKRPYLNRDQRDSMIGGASDGGQGFVYSGQIEKGQMHGKGTLVYPNGSCFLAASVLVWPCKA